MTKVHPGKILTDLIEVNGLSKTKVAQDINISRQHLYDIMKEKKPVSVDIALKLGKYFGNGVKYWNDLQNNYSAEKAEREQNLSAIEPLKF